MNTPAIRVKPAEPEAVRAGRQFFADLIAATRNITKAGLWHEITTFPDNPRRAYWYAARLRKRLADRFDFCATAAGEGGKLYGRLRKQAVGA
jgi:hypothetical protein